MVWNLKKQISTWEGIVWKESALALGMAKDRADRSKVKAEKILYLSWVWTAVSHSARGIVGVHMS